MTRLLCALDPSLLLYDPDKWSDPSCIDRLAALDCHWRHVSGHGFKFAITDEFVAVVCDRFPWNINAPQLRDLREFIFDGLAKAERLTGDPAAEFELSSACASLFRDCGVDEALSAWDGLIQLWAAEVWFCEAAIGTIGTWARPNLPGGCGEDCSLRYGANEKKVDLVWDEASWATLLANWCASLFWPDLERCVEFYIDGDRSFALCTRSFSAPRRLRLEDNFKSTMAGLRPEDDLVPDIIKAVSKAVCGVFDSGLKYESIRGRPAEEHRFRVSGSQRIHAREEGNTLTLTHFGGHRLDGVG